MPTKWLPDSANLDHLRHQAKDLRRDYRAGEMAAFQRVREFHPRFGDVADADMPAMAFKLADAQLSIAREYGYPSWPRLKAVVEGKHYEELGLSYTDRLPDGPFRQALVYMDAGDAARLRQLLAQHPALVHQEVTFEGGNYFKTPTLLEFLPQNPTRQDRLPTNAIAIAEILLAAGAKDNLEALNETLLLAASGQSCRESGLQPALLKLLCAHGADPAAAMQAALMHSEFDAVRTLLACGAPLDLIAAATLGETEAVQRLLNGARGEDVQLALATAANTAHAGIITMLIAAGADPNRYNPPGGHSHCTPLHSAVASNQPETVAALVAGGAEQDIKDILHGATPLDWAEHLQFAEIAAFLRSRR